MDAIGLLLMRWRPSLVVRFGRGGSLLSPTSNTGYAFYGAMAAVMTCAVIAAALSGEPLFLVGLAITGLFLRDTWAWFAATDAEKAAFRARIAELQLLGHAPPADQTVIGQNWGLLALGGLLAWLGFSILMVVRGQPAFLVSVMFAASFTVLAAVDLARKRLRSRGSR